METWDGHGNRRWCEMECALCSVQRIGLLVCLGCIVAHRGKNKSWDTDGVNPY